MKNNNKGFSIVLAMGITIVLGMISILILEYIIPFSRNIKGVENSSSAYYHGFAGVEESLWFLSQNTLGTNTSMTFPTAATGSEYTLQSMTSIIPPAGDGNSEYDGDWNRFDTNTPIQLQLPAGTIDFDNVDFIFRIPNIDGSGATATGTLTGTGSDPIINWILTGLENNNDPIALHGISGNYITKTNVNNMTNAGGITSLGSKNGLTLDDRNCDLKDFYEHNCEVSGSGVHTKPTLKLSIIDELKLTGGQLIPYLEYKIDFGVPVPGRYSQIDTAGKSYGYKKTMDIKVPQLSTNQAFDFAVFQ